MVASRASSTSLSSLPAYSGWLSMSPIVEFMGVISVVVRSSIPTADGQRQREPPTSAVRSDASLDSSMPPGWLYYTVAKRLRRRNPVQWCDFHGNTCHAVGLGTRELYGPRRPPHSARRRRGPAAEPSGEERRGEERRYLTDDRVGQGPTELPNRPVRGRFGEGENSLERLERETTSGRGIPLFRRPWRPRPYGFASGTGDRRRH